MKVSLLSLIVAATAFGASSIYLWSQLHDERVRAEEFDANTAKLNARIAELEKLRSQFEERRFASANTFGGGPAMVGAGHPPPPETVINNETGAGTPEGAQWTVQQSPERSAAMQRMMRAQLRANNKRLYADVGTELGLSKEQAKKLVDLLTDQQTIPFVNRRVIDPADAHDAFAEKQQQLQSEIADLIGPEKAASLREYQASLPDRQELDMVSRQLEGYDAPLSDYQRKLMLTAMAEERERVPAPQYGDATNMEEFQKVRMAWEDDYNERVTSQARSILDSEQLTAYSEYQQAQKDMRAQFATMMPHGPRPMMRGVAGGNVTYSAAPVAGAFIQADAVTVAVPADPDKK